jgi:cell wall-associated NlpC family hydrolase
MTPGGRRGRSGGEAPYGIVAIASLEMRSGPDHRHELTNQLLLGEAVRRLASREGGRWWHAEGLADGYRGWIRTWGIQPATGDALEAWQSAARARVSVLNATARERPRGSVATTPLPWRARVAVTGTRGGWTRLALPAGGEAWVERSQVAREGTPPPTLAQRLDTLWGIPYLWGGRTAAGLDCSGFTQQVLGEQGWRLPRDAHEQWETSRPLRSARAARPGDLLFFSSGGGRVGHVGIWVGGGHFAHARGVVRINSLDPKNPLCDKELMAQFVGFGRPVVRGLI